MDEAGVRFSVGPLITMLKKEFFKRSAIVVARDLVGKVLVRKISNKILRFKIVETEAYEGSKDLASHASRGQTQRNTPMFGEAGTIYVYFTYGMHHMLNIVCARVGHPSAVLIRGLQGVVGPGRLTKKLEINKDLNNKKLGKASGLWVEQGGVGEEKIKILRTPRIGIDYSGPIWSKKLYRFVLFAQ